MTVGPPGVPVGVGLAGGMVKVGALVKVRVGVLVGGFHKILRQRSFWQAKRPLHRCAGRNGVLPIPQRDQPISTSATPSTVSAVPTTIRAVISMCLSSIALSATVTSG